MPESNRSSTVTRTKAAVGVVALAVLLAAAGLVSAIRQVRLLENQRLLDARAEAKRLVVELHEKVRARTDSALEEVARTFLNNAAAGDIDRDPMNEERRPTWLGDLYILHHTQTSRNERRHWPGLPSGASSEDVDDNLNKIIFGWLEQRLMMSTLSPTTGGLTLYYEQVGNEHVLLIHRMLDAPPIGPFIVAAKIDLARLRSSFILPLLAGSAQRIRIVGSYVRGEGWSEPLVPAMPFWELQPTPTFVRAQRNAVLRQTAIYVAVTVLALIALLAVFWSLAQLVRREVALSELKSAFVADVSHELKTPLALIRMFGETLADGRVPSEEKRMEYYRIITRESTRLTHLIDNILDFARIDAGRKEYRLAPVNIGEVVRWTYDSYRYDLEHNGFTHELQIEDNLPTVRADSDAVSQAILNLLTNAVKYSADEKFVRIIVGPETRRGKHGVLITVEDRGIGISPEARSRLFEGFYRATDERVRRKRGAGLGLAVVKHIVDAHEGIIDVESRLVKGTAFRIFLPQAATDDGQGADTSPGAPSMAGT